MNYWIVKGSPAENDWDSMLRSKRPAEWHTARPPRAWASGDRLFFWESTPNLRIIAVGTLVDPDFSSDSGEKLFRVRYLTRRLSSMPTIHELRNLPIVSESSFLKRGPATTVLALTQPQGERYWLILPHAIRRLLLSGHCPFLPTLILLSLAELGR